MKHWSQKTLLLVVLLLVLGSIGIMLLVRYPFDYMGSSAFTAGESEDARRARPLAEATGSEFLTVFVYGEEGEVAAYMVGGQTDEFASFREAVTGATPAPGGKDESFSDLLVFSFEDGSTLEVAYSPGRNAIYYDEKLYTLSVELQPLISAVEERFNE